MITRDMVLVINFSGGKDSSAMLSYLCEKYPHYKKYVVFADTGWEHKGAIDWCNEIVKRFGMDIFVVRNPNKDFFGMVRHRKMFPSPGQRQCTSDLKRGPIQTWIRRNCRERLIVNCLGIRAEESPARAKKRKLSRNIAMTNSKRTVWDWLPIHDWTETQVLKYLSDRNIPLHPVYNYLKRFSCQVCIYMSVNDLKSVAKNNPSAILRIDALEKEIGFTLKPDGAITDLIERR